METHYLTSEEKVASIKAQRARHGMQPQAPIVQPSQVYYFQHQAIPQLKQRDAAVGPPPPPVPPPSKHVYNVNSSSPPQ